MIEEALHVVSDPGHILAEAIFITAEAAIITPIIKWWVRHHDRKVHGHPVLEES